MTSCTDRIFLLDKLSQSKEGLCVLGIKLNDLFIVSPRCDWITVFQ